MEAPVGRIRHARCDAAPPELEDKGVRMAGAINMPPLAGLEPRLDMCWNGSRSTIRLRCTPRGTISRRFARGTARFSVDTSPDFPEYKVRRCRVLARERVRLVCHPRPEPGGQSVENKNVSVKSTKLERTL
jgi:hypothetical protein